MPFGSLIGGFAFSCREIEELLASRGVLVSYEAVRSWYGKFGQSFPARLTTQAASRPTLIDRRSIHPE